MITQETVNCRHYLYFAIVIFVTSPFQYITINKYDTKKHWTVLPLYHITSIKIHFVYLNHLTMNAQQYELTQWVLQSYSGKLGSVDSILYLVLATWPTAAVCARFWQSPCKFVMLLATKRTIENPLANTSTSPLQLDITYSEIYTSFLSQYHPN